MLVGAGDETPTPAAAAPVPATVIEGEFSEGESVEWGSETSENCESCSANACGSSCGDGCGNGCGSCGSCGHKCGCGLCEMPQHHAYYPVMHGYYYFRPYHHSHVAQQQLTATSWGEDPRAPYANSVFQKVYEEYKAERAAIAAENQP